MKRCSVCKRTYTDESLNFCLEDGTPLDVVTGSDPNATISYSPRDTGSPYAGGPREVVANPPPTEIYPPQTPVITPANRAAAIIPPQSLPPPIQRKKSNAVWWILGGIVVVGIIVVGVGIMILALAGMSSRANTNVRNTNSRTTNRNSNANTNTANTSNVNSNAKLPSSVTDDFSETKWGTGNFAFGDVWYADGQYHMRSKDKTYLVMYAPTNDYNTGDATVRVTVRSVDGAPAASGYGLIVHGEKSKAGDLEDYALLIYNGSEPQYEIIKHKGGAQTTVVPWTRSRVIRTSTLPNQLEVRAKGSELSFYINGQYVDRIPDSENFKRGIAGLYTSGSTEVAYDDLEIKR